MDAEKILDEYLKEESLPIGYTKLKGVEEVFILGDEVIVTGIPDEDDEDHNCDVMGCSSVSCVLLRARKVE